MRKSPSQKNVLLLPTLTSTSNTHNTSPNPDSNLNHLITILRKPFPDRKETDCTYIADFLSDFPVLINLLKSFANPQGKLLELSKLIKYKHYSEGDPIYSKGDFSDRVFLLIRGSAITYCEVSTDLVERSKLLDYNDEDSPMESQSALPDPKPSSKTLNRGLSQLFKPKMEKRTLQKHTTLGNIVDSDQANLQAQEPPSKEQIADVIDYGDPRFVNDGFSPEYKILAKACIKKPGKYMRKGNFTFKPKIRLPYGSFFGDVGILTSSLREWTVIAAEETYAVTLESEDYVRMFQEKFDQMSKNINFLRPFFPNTNKAKLIKLSHLFEESQLPAKSVTFEDGDDIDGFYLIKEGQVHLYKNIPLAGSSQKNGDARASPKPKLKKCMIAKIKEDEVLGEVDFFFQSKRDSTAIVASSSSVLLKMKSETFEELHPSYQLMFDSLKKASSQKLQVRQDKVKQHIQAEESREREESLGSELQNSGRNNKSTRQIQKLTENSPTGGDNPSYWVYHKVKTRHAEKEPRRRELGAITAKTQESHQSLSQMFLDLLSPEDSKRIVRAQKLAAKTNTTKKRVESLGKEEMEKDAIQESERGHHSTYLSKIENSRNIQDQKSLYFKPMLDEEFYRQASMLPLKSSQYKLKPDSESDLRSMNMPRDLIRHKMKLITGQQQQPKQEKNRHEKFESSIVSSMLSKDSLRLKLHPSLNKDKPTDESLRISKERRPITLSSVMMNYEEVNKMLNNDQRKLDLKSVRDMHSKSLERIKIRRQMKQNFSIAGHSNSGGRSFEWSKGDDHIPGMNFLMKSNISKL